MKKRLSKTSGYILFFAFAFPFSFSCNPTKNVSQAFPELINGSWKIVTPQTSTITGIEFNQGGGVIYNTGDTILRYSFEIKKSILALTDVNHVIIPNRILKLTRDSLIFKTLLWESGQQSFVRVKSLWNE